MCVINTSGPATSVDCCVIQRVNSGVKSVEVELYACQRNAKLNMLNSRTIFDTDVPKICVNENATNVDGGDQIACWLLLLKETQYKHLQGSGMNM